MNNLYIFLKYFFIVVWTVFVVAPFLWALTTSFKDFQSVNGGVTYIPWVDFEPNLALNGGLDGTLKIFKTIKKASTLLKKNGKLILEISHNQRTKVIKLLKQKGFYINKTIKDYAQNDRCIVSTKI